MDAAKSCAATFSLDTHTLTVSKAGTGSGTVTSSPVGIDCGADCTQDYDYNTVVTLTPRLMRDRRSPAGRAMATALMAR